jgi:metal-sulfur cluster biosynthetic enzyme
VIVLHGIEDRNLQFNTPLLGNLLMSSPDSREPAVWSALRSVIDPELGLDVVTLGLIYDVKIDDDVALVTHTLTTPGCPMEAIIGNGIRDAVLAVEGIDGIDRKLVWDPAWHAGMIARDAWTH